jgi:hypothetical protein
MDDWNPDKKKHSISDSNCNIAILLCPINFYKGWQIMFGLQLVLSKTNRLGDTKCNIKCSI